MPSPTNAPAPSPALVASAEGGLPAMTTFEEALAYIRPHPFTNGPVILKSGMLRCCVSAIIMRMGDLKRERDDYRDDSLRLHREKMDRLDRALVAEAKLSAALARAERLETSRDAEATKLADELEGWFRRGCYRPGDHLPSAWQHDLGGRIARDMRLVLRALRSCPAAALAQPAPAEEEKP